MNLKFPVILLVALIVYNANAENISDNDVTSAGDVITAKHRFMMGDNDTKSDATKVCFIEAKRKAVEYAGTYIESVIKINQTDTSRTSSSDIKTIASSLISSELVSKKFGFESGNMFVDCVVKAKVDKSQLKKISNE